MENNIKSEYEPQINSVKLEVNNLRKRIQELETELKKRTPLETASTIKLKKVHSTQSYFDNNIKTIKPSENTETKTNENEEIPETKTLKLQRAKTTTVNSTNTRNTNKPKKKLLLLNDIKKPNNKNNLKKKPKSPRTNKSKSKSPRARIHKPRKKSTGNVIGSPSTNKSKIKVVVGHRYLLLDDRYGVCKWTKGNKMGLELEVGNGNCSGELNGVKKFKCKKGMGLFVDVNQIQMDCGKA